MGAIGKGVAPIFNDERWCIGYNHKSLSAITPYLEVKRQGPSSTWARRTAARLGCTVAVGYPEKEPVARSASSPGSGDDEHNDEEGDGQRLKTSRTFRTYNSLIFVNKEGEIVAHTRKYFLYYTDETWAWEGDGFYTGAIKVRQRSRSSSCSTPAMCISPSVHGSSTPSLDHLPPSQQQPSKGNPYLNHKSERETKLAAGICMDINPYKFEAPWRAFEFANHILDSRAELVVVSMAWLTHKGRSEFLGLQSNDEVVVEGQEAGGRNRGVDGQDLRGLPDMETVGYWVERMRPLIESEGRKEGGTEEGDQSRQQQHQRQHQQGEQKIRSKETILVFANRCGQEINPPLTEPVLYAGSSTIMGFSPAQNDGESGGSVRIWDMLGRGEEGVLIVDTEMDPARYCVRIPSSTSESKSQKGEGG